MLGSNIHPIDRLLGRTAVARRDDIVGQLVDARAVQDRIVADIGGLRPAPSVQRLREAADVQREFAELFRDLEIPQPVPGDPGNPVGARLDHLRQLQRFSPEWRETKLGRVAAADADGFELIARDIVNAAKRIAANPTIGSIRNPGAMRPVTRVDSAGHKTTQWCGDAYSWMHQFYDPVLRCLVAYGDGRGRWW